ncbi:MAG: hypothetical protein ACT4ON_05910 [Bacteroidota bacterium]
MIIGETFNENSYYGYEEENYDYLFKRKSKEERQQKKEERKQNRTEKKQLRQDKRTEKKLQKQDPASGGKRRLPILGNFGLFDKNKNKKNAGTSGGVANSPAKKEPGDTSEPSTIEEKRIAMASAGAAATQDKSEGSKTSGNESDTEGSSVAKLESKELDKNGNPKKEAGFGPMFGFAMLGITVLVVGAVLYGVNKKSNPSPQSIKVAA